MGVSLRKKQWGHNNTMTILSKWPYGKVPLHWARVCLHLHVCCIPHVSHIVIPFWYTLATHKKSLVKPWFVFKLVRYSRAKKPMLWPTKPDISLKSTKRVWSGIYHTQNLVTQVSDVLLLAIREVHTDSNWLQIWVRYMQNCIKYRLPFLILWLNNDLFLYC